MNEEYFAKLIYKNDEITLLAHISSNRNVRLELHDKKRCFRVESSNCMTPTEALGSLVINLPETSPESTKDQASRFIRRVKKVRELI